MAAVAAAVLLSACGEKNEDLSPPTDATTTTSSVPVVALEPNVVEARARGAASATLPKGIKIRPSEWTASCSGGETGGSWTCYLGHRPCKGKVIVSPPSGPEPSAITTDASGIRCRNNKGQ